MIKELEVTNFQGHKYSLLEFDKGVNNIKGTSHHGKSSLIRAMIWALQNKPSGFNFKSWFSTDKENTDVSIGFWDNSFITRTRDSKLNGYYVTGLDSPLEALRTDVPEEVSLISNMSNINIQSQAEKFFMLQETPGNVAKALNKIVGLEIIHEVNKTVSRIISSSLAESGRLKNEIEHKREEIKKYDNLEDVGNQIDQVDVIYSNVSTTQKHYNTLDESRREIKRKQNELADIEEWLEIEMPFKQIKKRQARLIKLKEKEEALNSLVNQCNNTIAGMEFAKDIISLDSDVKEAKVLSTELSELKNKHDELEKLYNDVQTVEKSLNSISDTLRTDTKERTQLLKSNKDLFCLKCGAYQQHWRKNENFGNG